LPGDLRSVLRRRHVPSDGLQRQWVPRPVVRVLLCPALFCPARIGTAVRPNARRRREPRLGSGRHRLRCCCGGRQRSNLLHERKRAVAVGCGPSVTRIRLPGFHRCTAFHNVRCPTFRSLKRARVRLRGLLRTRNERRRHADKETDELAPLHACLPDSGGHRNDLNWDTGRGGRCPLWVKSRHVRRTRRCPLWVISGHMQCKKPCPLYTQ
jgi:hypothetical protein